VPPLGNPTFREWVDQEPDPGWPALPLTHVTRGTNAQLIARYGTIDPSPCRVLGKETVYCFYGRAAYRPSKANVIKFEYDSPYCFIFDELLLGRADAIHAFDTGAHANRTYDHVLTEDMCLADFDLVGDLRRPNKLIARVFESQSAYFEGDRGAISDGIAQPWENLARAYVQLLKSPGRNEPDDRICSIEVAIHESVSLEAHLRAVVVPSTVWKDGARAPWLVDVEADGAQITPYPFVGGRPPEHYQAQIESSVRNLYRSWGIPI